MLLLDSLEFKPLSSVKGDRLDLIVEDVNGVKRTKARGQLSLCDTLNTNNRIYPRVVWENNLKDGSQLMERIKKNAAFGLLEHPEDGQVTLLSPISHIVTNAELNENGSVTGEITFLNTPEGRKMMALIEAGYNPLVSSRGYGSLATNDVGANVVQDDFICESWDVVMVPSVSTAELTPVTEAKEGQPKTSVTETKIPPAPPAQPAAPTKVPLPEAKAPEIIPAASAGTTFTTIIMDPTTIRQQLTGLSTLDPAKLTPQRFAESMRALGDLHNQVATWLSEDTKRTWQASKLHEEIDHIETTWSAAIGKPATDVVALTEERKKILAVTQKVTETGIALRKKLGESVLVNGKLLKTNRELLSRGKAWKKFSESTQAKKDKVDEKFEIAHTALDIMAARYKKLKESLTADHDKDVTRLGKRLIQLEFAEKLKGNVNLTKKLSEAKTPESIVAIRRILEGNKPKAAGKPEGSPIRESQPKPATRTAGAILENGGERQINLLQGSTGPRRLSESVALARRLSGFTPEPKPQTPVKA